MPISLSCPSCSRKLNAKDEHAGLTLKCPACQSAITIPGIGILPSKSPPPPPVAGVKESIYIAPIANEEPKQDSPSFLFASSDFFDTPVASVEKMDYEHNEMDFDENFEKEEINSHFAEAEDDYPYQELYKNETDDTMLGQMATQAAFSRFFTDDVISVVWILVLVVFLFAYGGVVMTILSLISNEEKLYGVGVAIILVATGVLGVGLLFVRLGLELISAVFKIEEHMRITRKIAEK